MDQGSSSKQSLPLLKVLTSCQTVRFMFARFIKFTKDVSRIHNSIILYLFSIIFRIILVCNNIQFL